MTVRVLPPIATEGMTAADVTAVTDELRARILESFRELEGAAHQS